MYKILHNLFFTTIHKPLPILITSCILVITSLDLHAQSSGDPNLSFEILGLVDENATAGQGGSIFNTTTNVPSGGGYENTLNVSNGAYVDFKVSLENYVDPYAHLRVTIDDIIIGDSVGSGDLMLAQTTNSQGLKDSGTLSFLMIGDGTKSATLRFDWYDANGNFDTPLEEQRFITSYDIDGRQYNTFLNSDLEGIALSETTDLQMNNSGLFTEVESLGGGAFLSDSEHAVAVYTNAISTQEIEVGNKVNSNALFMFEFRNPSQNLNENFDPSGIEELAPGAPTPPAFALMLFAALMAFKEKLKGLKKKQI